MNTSDWISIGAAAISLGSLYYARRAFNQTTRIKGTELRAELLLVMVDMTFKMSQCKNIAANVRVLAESKGDLELYKMAEELSHSIDSIAEHFGDVHDTLERVKPESALDTYARQRHEIEGYRKRVDDVHAHLLSLAQKVKTASA